MQPMGPWAQGAHASDAAMRPMNISMRPMIYWYTNTYIHGYIQW